MPLASMSLLIRDYSEAIQLNPEFAPAYNNRGNAYRILGRYELAIRDFDEAIRLNLGKAPHIMAGE